MLRQALTRLSSQERLRTVAMQNKLAQSFALRFVAGQTLQQAIEAVRRINGHGMSATLDHLGENVSTKAEAIDAADAYRHALTKISASGADCNVSLKLTHMGLDLGEDFACENVARVIELAAEHDNFVRIDMESSEYTDRTLAVFFHLYDKYKNVGTVIQSCLYRSEADLEQLIQAGARVRLVKGAYLEPREVAFQRKSEVDDSFVRLSQILLSAGNYPAIATHDERMIEATKGHASVNQITSSRYEFQMLYGIRRDLQGQLVRDGYRMRIYVPYGTHWYPYLMRRMAERPANLMFVLGSIAREAISGQTKSS